MRKSKRQLTFYPIPGGELLVKLVKVVTIK